MPKVSMEQIRAFLNAKRMAMIGVSRDAKSYSRQLYKELQKQGYDMVPVNPNASEIDGQIAVAHISQVSPKPERVILTLPEKLTEQAVIDCAQAGIKDIWLHRHVAGGVSDHRAIFRSEENEMNLITGYCMFMFLPKSGFIHQLHARIMKLFKLLPV